MRLLAIETSCDETALAIVEESEEGRTSDTFTFRVLANNTLSQIDVHKEYGGVFPALAKREHARALVPLLLETLKDASLYKETSRHVIESPLRQDFQDILEREPDLFAKFINEIPHINPPEIDAIAVTMGPGLEPALWVGINFAKALSLIWKKPVIAVNHMEGHLVSALLKQAQTHADGTRTDAEMIQLQIPKFPILALLVSGGHTELVLMRDFGVYEVIGETKDDAVGEAFDKVARILGLPYPGGPEISRLGERGEAGVYPLPRPMLHSPDYNFSFAGLKTAVLYLVKNLCSANTPSKSTHASSSPSLGGVKKLGSLEEQQKADIAREFEESAIEVLLAKTLRAAKEFAVQGITTGGGVSANKRLRERLKEMIAREMPGCALYLPDSGLTTDNALMIATAGFFKKDRPVELAKLRAMGNWRIGTNQY